MGYFLIRCLNLTFKESGSGFSAEKDEEDGEDDAHEEKMAEEEAGAEAEEAGDGETEDVDEVDNEATPEPVDDYDYELKASSTHKQMVFFKI